MSVKVFTLEEANRLIPEVRKAIVWFREAVQEIVQVQDAAGVLEMLGGDEKSSPEHPELLEKRLRLEELAQGYNQRLEEFQKLGCLIKDLNHGLVDFYGLKEGRLIFLCWKLGEPRINYWHETGTGMAGRRPVSEL